MISGGPRWLQYRGMQAGGIRPDEHTVATLVAAHTAAGQLEQAAHLLEGATAGTPEAPFYTVACNTLLDAWAHQVRDTAGAGGRGSSLWREGAPWGP